MINESEVTDIDVIEFPYGHTATLKEIKYENGMYVLRATIRQDRRFTVLDMDAARAEKFGQALLDWARDKLRDEQSAAH